ncbi:HTH_Tnp_Tc3_2 domain-containing protein [Trichonephila clavipes]|nr:HTH_Tnp_Tc3_2 domain-containing protein [Trichonephila clavipes]
MTARDKSIRTLTGRPERCSTLVDTRPCRNFPIHLATVRYGKLPDLEAFGVEIVGARRMSHSISEIVRQLGVSRSMVSRIYQEYIDGGQKTSDRASSKRQLILTERDERRLRCIVRSQRSKTLAQITTQLNDGANRTVSKPTVQRSLHRMCFGSRLPTRVALLNARHRAERLAWAREHRDWSVENWKQEAWSDESRSDYLTPTRGSEYGVKCMKQWILHARLELYKNMAA